MLMKIYCGPTFNERFEMRIARLAKWHNWFAWHPIRIGHHWLWLEWVLRRGDFHEDSHGGSMAYEYDSPRTMSEDL